MIIKTSKVSNFFIGYSGSASRSGLFSLSSYGIKISYLSINKPISFVKFSLYSFLSSIAIDS